MHTPKITVLMTVYNGGHYLMASVQSVLQQNFEDFEFLIIDDCSRDGAVDAIEALGSNRIRIHRNPVNIGQTASLNLGLSLARGQWVARMDADDIAYPEWLKKQASYMDLHSECVAVSCMAVVMDEAGKIHKHLRQPSCLKDMVLKSFFASPLNHVGVLMRKEIILEKGGYDPSKRIAADYGVWSTLLRAGFVLATLPYVGVAIRAHGNSVSAVNKGSRDCIELCVIIAENVKHFTGYQLSEEQLRLFWTYAYAPESLTVQDFMTAQGLAKDIYGRLNTTAGQAYHTRACNFNRRQEKVFFFKALFGLARAGRHQQINALIRISVQKHGWMSFYGIVALASGGGALGGFLSAIYDALRNAQAALLKKKVLL